MASAGSASLNADHVADRMAQRRSRVVRAAARLMARDGFHSVSMQAIAREAGVSVGSLYLYVENKHDLLLAVLTDVLAEFGRGLPDAIAQHDDPVHRLRAGFVAYCQVLDRNRDAAVLAYRETRTLPRGGRELVQHMEVDTARPLAEVITEGQQAGLLDPSLIAPLIAHDLIVLGQAWALKHWYYSRLVSLDEYVAAQFALVLRGSLHTHHHDTYRALLAGASDRHIEPR